MSSYKLVKFKSLSDIQAEMQYAKEEGLMYEYAWVDEMNSIANKVVQVGFTLDKEMVYDGWAIQDWMIDFYPKLEDNPEMFL
jgi:hypothetical protein